MSRTSPTQRTLADLRAKGYTVAITERWNAYARIRQDLLGFCDVLALAPGAGIVAVQTTSDSHLANRRTKILAEPRALVWLQSGGRIVLHGWRKKGRNWVCRQEEIVKADFAEAVLQSTPARPSPRETVAEPRVSGPGQREDAKHPIGPCTSWESWTPNQDACSKVAPGQPRSAPISTGSHSSGV